MFQKDKVLYFLANARELIDPIPELIRTKNLNPFNARAYWHVLLLLLSLTFTSFPFFFLS